MRNPFVELNAIDVGDHVEEKNGLKYLSWAWAETEIKKRFPFTTLEVVENPDARPIIRNIKVYEGTEEVTDRYGKKKEVPKCVGYEKVEILDRRLWPTVTGATVRTRVTVRWFEDDGKEYSIVTEDQLPVMTPANKAVPLEDIDSLSLNKTIQRSLTKAIAMQGLGMYIYAGEDLPEDPNKGEVIELKGKIEKLCAVMKTLPDEKRAETGAKFKEIIGDGKGLYKKCEDVDILRAAYEYLAEATRGE